MEGDRIYLQSGTGRMAFIDRESKIELWAVNVGPVKPGPDCFAVVSQFRVTKGSDPHRAYPFIANGKLLMQHGEVLMVFDIKE